MKPFLKWAGGKRQLLSELLKHVPAEFEIYHEPFVGGGALFWEVGAKGKNAVLGDSNERLMRTYRAVRDDVERVITSLENRPHTEDFFYWVREQEPDKLNDAELSAWFIYLNKTCFNGLYRVNKTGGFNVPFGAFVNPNICDKETLRACSNALQGVDLHVGDFEHTIRHAGRGDFVYFDPPYIPVAATSFTAYTGSGFGPEDHERLAECARQLKQRGAYVLLSNSSAPIVRELYHDFEIIEVGARRAINSKASKRGAVKEVIIK